MCVPTTHDRGRQSSAVALNGLGACFERMGDPWQAERLMSEAAGLLRTNATPFERVVTLTNLCTVAIGAYHLQRDGAAPEQAPRTLERALELAREARPHSLQLGDRYGIEKITTTWNEVVVDRDKALDGWIPHIKDALDKKLQVFGYVNNHYSGYAPENVDYLLDHLPAASTPHKSE